MVFIFHLFYEKRKPGSEHQLREYNLISEGVDEGNDVFRGAGWHM